MRSIALFNAPVNKSDESATQQANATATAEQKIKISECVNKEMHRIDRTIIATWATYIFIDRCPNLVRNFIL